MSDLYFYYSEKDDTGVLKFYELRDHREPIKQEISKERYVMLWMYERLESGINICCMRFSTFQEAMSEFFKALPDTYTDIFEGRAEVIKLIEEEIIPRIKEALPIWEDITNPHNGYMELRDFLQEIMHL
jgi:hypothetical protein